MGLKDRLELNKQYQTHEFLRLSRKVWLNTRQGLPGYCQGRNYLMMTVSYGCPQAYHFHSTMAFFEAP